MNKIYRKDIYCRKSSEYERELRKLQSYSISANNKEIVKRFHQYAFSQGTSENRVAKMSWELRIICDALQKDLDKVCSKDIERLVAFINQKATYAEATKSDYRRMIRAFYAWFEEEDTRLESGDKAIREEAAKLYKYIKKNVKRGYKPKSIDYSNIITDDDCITLIDKGCQNVMERAFVSVLHSTGFRIAEHLGIRIKDVEIKDACGWIRVDGKTGERRVPILQPIPYIIQWLQEHPQREDPNAFLWVSKHNLSYAMPINYVGAKKILYRVFRNAGYIEVERIQKQYSSRQTGIQKTFYQDKVMKIIKPCNCHWFRHSRATLWAAEYTESILCKLMGWAPGSKQVQTYVHLGAKQVEKAFLENNGIVKKNIEPKTITCICSTINSPGSRYCYKCGKPLSVGTVLEDEKKKNDAIGEAFEIFAKIMADPQLRAQFESFKQKTNGGMKT